MERSPSPSAEEHHGNTSKDKKTSKRAAILRVPLVFEQEQRPAQPQPAEKTKPSALEAALANLAAGNQDAARPEAETAEQPTKSKESELVPSETEGSSPEVTSDEAELVESDGDIAAESDQAVIEAATEPGQDAEESYEPLPYWDLKSVDLSGGEVVVHLQGDVPVSERVVPVEATADTLQFTAAEAPVLRPQIEQQHQARAQEQLPLAGSSAVAEVNPRPSETPITPSETAPQAAMPPVEILYQGEAHAPQLVVPNVMSTPRSEQPASKRDVENMAYRAERAGQNRGVFAGLLVGGGYEHFKHKRRERRKDKQLQAQSKQLESARQGYNVGLQEQARLRTEAQVQQTSIESQVGSIERRLGRQLGTEQSKVRTQERIATEPAEQLEIPPEHRLEASAWHTIEVDARTGKPVENPAFQYGQEYHRERAQESALGTQQQGNEGATAAAAPSAVAMSATTPTGDDHANLPPVYIPSATTQRPPTDSTQDVPKGSSATDAKSKSADANPAPLWPWVLALVVVVITLIVVLR